MTDICGVYEIPLKVVAVETGIEESMVKKVLDRFENDNKIFYEKGWVAIKNFQKHQTLNPSVRAGIENGLSKAPKEIVDRLSTDSDSLSHLNLNSNLNINPNTNLIVREPTPLEISKDFFLKGKYYEDYLEEFSKNNQIDVVTKEFDKFIVYWTEPNSSGKKQRWQMQPVFDVKRRLVTWLGKINTFKHKQTKII